MKRQLFVWLSAVTLVSVLLVYGSAQKKVTVELKNGQGESVGTATISPGGGGVRIALDLKNLTPGQHGIHIHQMAKCEAPGFTTAGPHFNPDSKMHGTKNPQGPHAGDMLNFMVKADGTAHATVTDARVVMGDGPNGLFSNGGTALIIHEKADDYKTDPSGNSGARIACGTITQ